MALNIPGVAVMMFFYLLVLGIGIWASFKSKREAKKTQGDKTEMALLGNRGINLVVGIFTMTGEYRELQWIYNDICNRRQQNGKSSCSAACA